MRTSPKITKQEQATFERYLGKRITVSEACRKLGYLRNDTRGDFNTFYRRFHHFIIMKQPVQ